MLLAFPFEEKCKCSEAVTGGILSEKVFFFEVLQNSQENTCVIA